MIEGAEWVVLYWMRLQMERDLLVSSPGGPSLNDRQRDASLRACGHYDPPAIVVLFRRGFRPPARRRLGLSACLRDGGGWFSSSRRCQIQPTITEGHEDSCPDVSQTRLEDELDDRLARQRRHK